jgi:hypothetical protein
VSVPTLLLLLFGLDGTLPPSDRPSKKALLPLSHCWRSDWYMSPPVSMTCSLARPRASATTSTNVLEPSSVTSTPGARSLGREHDQVNHGIDQRGIADDRP